MYITYTIIPANVPSNNIAVNANVKSESLILYSFLSLTNKI